MKFPGLEKSIETETRVVVGCLGLGTGVTAKGHSDLSRVTQKYSKTGLCLQDSANVPKIITLHTQTD